MYIDSFSTDLADIPAYMRSDLAYVLRVLDQQADKRYSIFDATEHIALARTMTRICRDGYIEADTSCGYPWTAYTLTAKGRAEIGKP